MGQEDGEKSGEISFEKFRRNTNFDFFWNCEDTKFEKIEEVVKKVQSWKNLGNFEGKKCKICTNCDKVNLWEIRIRYKKSNQIWKTLWNR